MRILLGLCAAILLYVWYTAISLIVSDYSLVYGRETDNIERLSQSLAANTENVLGSMKLAIYYLEAWILDHPDADPRFDPRFVKLTNLYRAEMRNMVDIRMVSESGGLFYIPSKSATPSADVSDREYYRAQLSLPPGNFHFAKSVLSRVTGKWGIPISYRMAVPSHGIFILFAAVELDVLAERFAQALPGTTATIMIVRNDGTILDLSPFDDSRLGGIAEKNPKNAIVSETAIVDLPLSVLVTISADEIMALWRRNSALRLLMALVVTVVILCLTWFVSSQWRRIGEYQSHVEKLAGTDFLTSLNNRQEFFGRLDEELTRSKRYGKTFGFLIVDLDKFKSINDRFGHPEGDRILSEFAATFKAALRVSDTCARIGGEEFAAFLPETERDGAKLIAERVRAAARDIHTPDNACLTVSVGVAVWLPGEETADLLYSRADRALYQAKESGRDRVILD